MVMFTLRVLKRESVRSVQTLPMNATNLREYGAQVARCFSPGRLIQANLPTNRSPHRLDGRADATVIPLSRARSGGLSTPPRGPLP